MIHQLNLVFYNHANWEMFSNMQPKPTNYEIKDLALRTKLFTSTFFVVEDSWYQ